MTTSCSKPWTKKGLVCTQRVSRAHTRSCTLHSVWKTGLQQFRKTRTMSRRATYPPGRAIKASFPKASTDNKFMPGVLPASIRTPRNFPGKQSFMDFFFIYIIETGDKDDRVLAKDLYSKYVSFCKKEEEAPADRHNVGRFMNGMGYESNVSDWGINGRHRKCVFCGLAFVDDSLRNQKKPEELSAFPYKGSLYKRRSSRVQEFLQTRTSPIRRRATYPPEGANKSSFTKASTKTERRMTRRSGSLPAVLQSPRSMLQRDFPGKRSFMDFCFIYLIETEDKISKILIEQLYPRYVRYCREEREETAQLVDVGCVMSAMGYKPDVRVLSRKGSRQRYAFSGLTFVDAAKKNIGTQLSASPYKDISSRVQEFLQTRTSPISRRATYPPERTIKSSFTKASTDIGRQVTRTRSLPTILQSHKCPLNRKIRGKQAFMDFFFLYVVETKDETDGISRHDLYSRYCSFCQKVRHQPTDNMGFGRLMNSMGYSGNRTRATDTIDGKQKNMYRGLVFFDRARTIHLRRKRRQRTGRKVVRRCPPPAFLQSPFLQNDFFGKQSFMDFVSKYIIETKDETDEIRADEFYSRYINYCRKEHRSPASIRDITQVMRVTGYLSTTECYRGSRLRYIFRCFVFISVARKRKSEQWWEEHGDHSVGGTCSKGKVRQQRKCRSSRNSSDLTLQPKKAQRDHVQYPSSQGMNGRSCQMEDYNITVKPVDEGICLPKYLDEPDGAYDYLVEEFVDFLSRRHEYTYD